jgi:alpha-amylase/alpha-mannosidase (GH57 family)
MARFLCVHGHFYQPPRENPWLETIERQASAYPYANWNARITAECYAPNAASRMLDGDLRIASIVNNYSRISFNFGPTLLAWLEAEDPAVYAAVLDADRVSRERYGGHGSAMAQAYNHLILPLANRRDKQTQILWGLRDFERRFGRPAAGMWLPETAVDLESLDLMAAHGVQFTILEPHQAARVRPMSSGAAGAAGPAVGAAGKAEWRSVDGGGIDPTRPYSVRLPSGRRMAVFFYDGPISRAVAFEGLLTSGERFASRLLSGVPHDDRPDGEDGAADRLVHIATDGETYGHHHRHGEMALTFALHHIEANGWATLTNYAQYLAAHPPTDEVAIVENSSWSCVHGVDRWREDCGCRIGGEPGWNQAWRAPLRQALDELRDELIPLYEQAAGELFAGDPWDVRDDYVEVVLDRSPAGVDRFLTRHLAAPATPARRVRALELLEMQRHAMLMYTSCGWFFDDLAGLEGVQVLRYAGRAAQLADRLFGGASERRLLRRLAWARSNDPKIGTGRDLYEARVRPAAVTPRQVAAHYAVRSLFADYPSPAVVHGHAAERVHGLRRQSGSARLAVGRLRLRSLATEAEEELCFAALYRGDPHLTAGVCHLVEDGEQVDSSAPTAPASAEEAVPELTAEAYQRFSGELEQAFGEPDQEGDLARAVELLDRGFAHAPYSLESLIGDEQGGVLDSILAGTLADVERQLHVIFDQQAPLMRFLGSVRTPLPAPLRAAADFVVNADLRRALGDGEAEPAGLERRLAEAAAMGVALDAEGLGLILATTLSVLLERLRVAPDEPGLLARAAARLALAQAAPFAVDLWRAQNLGHELRETAYPPRRAAAEAGDDAAAVWVGHFRRVADGLSLRLP